MARRQKQPRAGETWIRTLDAGEVTVLTLRIQRVHYESETGRRLSSTLTGFLQRFQPKAKPEGRSVPRLSNVVNINRAGKKWNTPHGRKAANGGGFMTAGRPGHQIG